MDVSDLNVLLTKIVRQIKLCHCFEMISKLSPLHDEENNIKSASSSSLKNEQSNDTEETSDKENFELFHAACPSCSSDLPVQEKEIVLKMHHAFYKMLQDTGINWDTISSFKSLQNTDIPESTNYEIKCDMKYLKRNAKGETALHTAARKRDVQSVVNMLQNYVNPNTQDNAGWTPLHEAVFDDNYEITLELLSAGAVINVPGFDFTTPLHVATHHNNIPMVRLLLKFGADPLTRDISGRTPEFYAKDSEIISLLDEYSKNTDIVEVAKKFQSPVAPRPMIIFLTSHNLITPDQTNYLKTELNFRFSNELNKEITHVVIEHCEENICEPTYEVMKAIVMGCVLVNKYWLHSCETNNKIMNFSDFEVNGTVKHPMTNGPRKALNNVLQMSPPLFTGCYIFLKKLSVVTTDAGLVFMSDLVLASGAKILNREPNPEHAPTNYFLYHCPEGHSMENTSTIILYEEKGKPPKLKYNMKHIKSLPVTWFFDCIQTFSILEPS